MALVKTETETEIKYEDGATCVIVKKDNDNLDVRQITPVGNTDGQTWQTVRDFLDEKLQ